MANSYTKICSIITTMLLAASVYSLDTYSDSAAEIEITKDEEGNLYLLKPNGPRPTLLYLSCTGGGYDDMDTARVVFDSLGWNVAVCAKSKNHRDTRLNDEDILVLVDNLNRYPQVDKSKIFIYGFSGQGAQALRIALKYPDKFGGIITQCAHDGMLEEIDWKYALGMPVLLMTRESDWNRASNRKIARILEQGGVNVKLFITPGEHKIGDRRELLFLCRTIMKNL